MARVRLPGDKSISHRALILAALANGISRLTDLSPGADVVTTRRCLEQCGVTIHADGDTIIVEGNSGSLIAPNKDLDAGNSGTTARLLLGLLAGLGLPARLTGDASLSRRPMLRVTEPLQLMGADIRLSHAGTLPAKVNPAPLKPLSYALPIASAQVKSALLLAALVAGVPANIIEPTPSRNHTELLLQALGIDLQISGNKISLDADKQSIPPFDIEVPGDPSSAAFPAALAAILPGTEVTFENLLLNPTRLGFFHALDRMGAGVIWSGGRQTLGEEVGRLTIKSAPLSGIEISGDEIPLLIDELPVIAVLASQAQGITVVRDAAELRVKESDRIRAVCDNLARMGGSITELPDGFQIQGPTPLEGAEITTGGDHRIAMAFAVAGCLAEGPTTLDDPGCVAVSFPSFFDLITRVLS